MQIQVLSHLNKVPATNITDLIGMDLTMSQYCLSRRIEQVRTVAVSVAVDKTLASYSNLKLVTALNTEGETLPI